MVNEKKAWLKRAEAEKKSQKFQSIRKVSSIHKMKDYYCHNIALAKVLESGDPRCRINKCGGRMWQCAYHIYSKANGTAVFLDKNNIEPACYGCNVWEKHWRGHDVDEWHIELFGKDRMEAIWAKKRETMQLNKNIMRDLLQESRNNVIRLGGIPK